MWRFFEITFSFSSHWASPRTISATSGEASHLRPIRRTHLVRRASGGSSPGRPNDGCCHGAPRLPSQSQGQTTPTLLRDSSSRRRPDGRAIDARRSRKEHAALSRELARFSVRADEIVRAHHGTLVYAGGDDVLAFVGLDQVLSCATKLAECFADLMKPYPHESSTASSTLSVVSAYRTT